MVIEMRSKLTGHLNQMDIPITAEELEAGIARWNAGHLIQRVFPDLSNHEREFLMTGATPEEWDAIFGEEEDYDG